MANKLIDLQQLTQPVEPVDAELVKLWAKIDYNTDDTLIDILIPAAREVLERATGLAFATRQLKCEFYHDGEHSFELPYQPFVSVVSVEYRACKFSEWADITGQDSYELEGSQFKALNGEPGIYRVVYYGGYATGYNSLPYQIQQAICQQVTYMYEHRESAEVDPIAMKSMYTLNRNLWL
jgi:uncharacterized phiE125 gp8 family phage protein